MESFDSGPGSERAMSDLQTYQIMREAFMLSLLLPAPVMVLGLIVGVLVSFIQAVTQIHEPTLVFIPKMVVTALALLVGGHWMMSLLVNFTARLLQAVPAMVR